VLGVRVRFISVMVSFRVRVRIKVIVRPCSSVRIRVMFAGFF
jgi:hypothetical protein